MNLFLYSSVQRSGYLDDNYEVFMTLAEKIIDEILTSKCETPNPSILRIDSDMLCMVINHISPPNSLIALKDLVLFGLKVEVEESTLEVA